MAVLIKHGWNLSNLPPPGHPDVGPYFWDLFLVAKEYKESLQIPDRARANYRLYRGDHWQKTGGKNDKNKVTVNLFFANVQRTKSNLTSRNPQAEVVDLTGSIPQVAKLLTARLRKWWKDTNQRRLLGTSALKMEKYGITIEKPVWMDDTHEPGMIVYDIFGFFPAPGVFADISRDAPYICFADAMFREDIAQQFGVDVEEIDQKDTYRFLGDDRKDLRPRPMTGTYSSPQYSGGFQVSSGTTGSQTTDLRQGFGEVAEVWVRDYSMENVPVQTRSSRSGGVMEEEVERYKYPGRIRCVSLTNEGNLVLSDKPNPNINHKLIEKYGREAVSQCYLYNHLPCHVANSYEDSASIWGFSAAEQTSDLIIKIDEIVTKLVQYVKRAMFPPLIIPRGCGIKKSMLNTRPNLILTPTNPQLAAQIRFVQMPSLPPDFFRILELLIMFFDRVYQIEDADRGKVPDKVRAAAAIVALQERNALLMQDKIKSVDHLVERRGMSAISLYQNFGWTRQLIEVDGESVPFIGIDTLGGKFNYVVESGSTMPKTSLQTQEQMERYYQMGAVDRQALLENSGIPDWKAVIERVGEGMLNQALQVLIQAGLPSEIAARLRAYLVEPQHREVSQGGSTGASRSLRSPPSPQTNESNSESIGV